MVEGELPLGVTAKDLALHIIGRFGADGGIYQSIEFSGHAIEAMSMDSRAVLPNMMAEFGVKNAYIAPDAKLFEWLAPRYARRMTRDKSRATSQEEIVSRTSQIADRAVYPDANATYAAAHRIEARTLEPLIACPHTVDNVKPISQVKGRRVQQAFIGTCTNGRLEDLAAAAEIVRGRHVASGTRLLIIPASSQVLLDALERGYVKALVEAGAVLGTPGCGPCMGNHMGVPAPGETTISSANRNFRGRMGTRDAEIYLASPAVVAASAIAGYIADPREIF